MRVFKKEDSVLRTIGIRLFILGLLFTLALTILYIDRDGLKNTQGKPIDFVDIIYFTVITVTTVGYGDIIPVTGRAKLIDAFLITPIRAFVWLLFLGTTYQITLKKYMEGYRLKKFTDSLKNHYIVCGFGTTGQSAVTELLNRNFKKKDIVIIDKNPEVMELVQAMGLSGLLGDATTEILLLSAAIKKAKALIIATGRDDTNILICLTAKNLNSNLKIIGIAHQIENIKLLKTSGMDIVVATSALGGQIIASAVLSNYAPLLIQDMMTSEKGLTIHERKPRENEVGSYPNQIKNVIIIALIRGRKKYSFDELTDFKIEKDDILLVIERV